MGTLKSFVTPLHKKTKRNYLERMNNNKVSCSKVAKKYSNKYWDGDRKFGYGGYKYIPGRWKSVAAKLIKEYKSSDIYLNLSRVESFGITFIETLASGTPIISFNTKGANEIINSNHNGFIIKDFNLDDFVQKIEQIKNDRTILKKIKQNSKSSVKKYDLNYNTKLLNNFYLRIITT